MMKNILFYLLFDDFKTSFPISWVGRIMAIVTAIAVCMLVSGFLYMIPDKRYFYYFACAASLIYICVKGNIRLNCYMVFFYVVILLNVSVLPINPMFRSQERALFFVFITLVCSPAITSISALAYRERVFKYTLVGLSVLSLLSFFCFFLGVNMMPFNREGSEALYDDYANVGGKFSGLFTHSMIFGPVSAIVSLVHFNLYLKNSKTIRLILFFLCFMSCVFSASRAALLGLGLGFLFVFFKAIRSPNSYISSKKIGRLVVFVSLAVLPLVSVAFSGLLNKIAVTQDEFGGYNSREIKYKSRLSEFEKAPILGVGFASIDVSTGDAYNPSNGQIEPGTSHLAVLAQTGVLGMIAYFMLLGGALKNIRKNSSLYAFSACSLFWFFFGHGWGEGWIFAPGGMICFLFWLSVAQCYDLGFRRDVS